MAALVVAGRSPADVTVTQRSSSPSTRAVRDGGGQDGNDAEDFSSAVGAGLHCLQGRRPPTGLKPSLRDLARRKTGVSLRHNATDDGPLGAVMASSRSRPTLAELRSAEAPAQRVHRQSQGAFEDLVQLSLAAVDILSRGEREAVLGTQIEGRTEAWS